MGDLLREADDWLNDVFVEHVATNVTYRRVAADGITITTATIAATKSKQMLRVADRQGGTSIVHTDADFILSTEDLIAAGFAMPPVEGDRLIASDSNGTSETFEVRRFQSEAHYRYCDPANRAVRVHCKRVS